MNHGCERSILLPYSRIAHNEDSLTKDAENQTHLPEVESELVRKQPGYSVMYASCHGVQSIHRQTYGDVERDLQEHDGCEEQYSVLGETERHLW